MLDLGGFNWAFVVVAAIVAILVLVEAYDPEALYPLQVGTSKENTFRAIALINAGVLAWGIALSRSDKSAPVSA